MAPRDGEDALMEEAQVRSISPGKEPLENGTQLAVLVGVDGAVRLASILDSDENPLHVPVKRERSLLEGVEPHGIGHVLPNLWESKESVALHRNCPKVDECLADERQPPCPASETDRADALVQLVRVCLCQVPRCWVRLEECGKHASDNNPLRPLEEQLADENDVGVVAGVPRVSAEVLGPDSGETGAKFLHSVGVRGCGAGHPWTPAYRWTCRHRARPGLLRYGDPNQRRA